MSFIGPIFVITGLVLFVLVAVATLVALTLDLRSIKREMRRSRKLG